MYLGFQSGDVLICDDLMVPSNFSVINWTQFNLDFKMKPISAIDIIDVGSKFVLVGDQCGQLVILNNEDVAFSE
jgi:hypothetical protein